MKYCSVAVKMTSRTSNEEVQHMHQDAAPAEALQLVDTNVETSSASTQRSNPIKP